MESIVTKGAEVGFRVIRAIWKDFITFEDETERKKKMREREGKRRETEREGRGRGKAVEWVSLVITAEVGAL